MKKSRSFYLIINIWILKFRIFTLQIDNGLLSCPTHIFLANRATIYVPQVLKLFLFDWLSVLTHSFYRNWRRFLSNFVWFTSTLVSNIKNAFYVIPNKLEYIWNNSIEQSDRTQRTTFISISSGSNLTAVTETITTIAKTNNSRRKKPSHVKIPTRFHFQWSDSTETTRWTKNWAKSTSTYIWEFLCFWSKSARVKITPRCVMQHKEKRREEDEEFSHWFEASRGSLRWKPRRTSTRDSGDSRDNIAFLFLSHSYSCGCFIGWNFSSSRIYSTNEICKKWQ